MGRVGNVSRDLPGKVSASGVRAARVLKKDAGNKSSRRRISPHATKGAVARALKVAPAKEVKVESVWESFGFSAVESVNLEVRAKLMREIESIIDKSGWTQVEAARQCNVSQPRLNDLLRGKITKFSMDALVNIAFALGRRVHLQLKAA